MAEIYNLYDEKCKKQGVMDFSELLLKAYELLRDDPKSLEYYQNRYKHILIDEFQDTNEIQFQWVVKMVSPQCKIMVVGDDDQSIFQWRGAKIGNIKQFKE